AFAQGITSSPVDNARTASVVPQNSPSATSASASDAPLESVNELQANTNVDPPQPVDSVAAALKTDDFAKPGADSVKSVDTPLPSSGGESSSTLNKPSSRPAWTVQALATTDRQDAKNWLDRLKTKGYDAYIVEAEIRGLSWYRIRVGNLATRQEAEELSKTLRTQEGFRDAFIAGSVKTDILMAASSRLPQLRPKH
ncbi:MAG TPA: SPOR domain-containing protein, partial [Terriglobales bacterium]|nr:SPOR domain-containing protein [Terriglobales bacterium]